MKVMFNDSKVLNTTIKHNTKTNIKSVKEIISNKNSEISKTFDLATEELGYYIYKGKRICVRFPR